jgi:hypothetical protein
MTVGAGNVKFFIFTGTFSIAKPFKKKHEMTTGSGNDI